MAILRRERIYFDSSVIGGYYDSEFAGDSRRVIAYAHEGRITILISEVVVQEILKAPARVQDVLFSIPSNIIERIELTPEILALRDAYVSAEKSLRDGVMTPCTLPLQLLPGLTQLYRGTSTTLFVSTRCVPTIRSTSLTAMAS